MAEFIQLEIKELPSLLVVGKEIRYSMEALMQGDNRLGKLWDTCFAENIFAALEAQPDYVYDSSYVGAMTDWDRGDGDFSYICGMLMREGAQVPQGYRSCKLVATRVAVGWIRGTDTADVCANAHAQTENALKEKGYDCTGMRWSMEVYNCPRFTTPDENGRIILDYYIPITNS